MAVDVLTISSKGQVVLPAPMRGSLKLDAGDKLAAYAVGDVIMLKPLKLPTEDDFKSWLDEATEWARSVGYIEEDVDAVIKDVRARKRA